MLESTKARLRRTKEFVGRHQTPIACTATAVVAVLVTRELDARIGKTFAYNTGFMAGSLAVYADLSRTFIEEKGLEEEFLKEFLPKMLK